MNSIIDEIYLLWDNLISGIINHVPNLILAVVVFLIGLLLAHIVQKIVKISIRYLGLKINEKLQNRIMAVDLQSSIRYISRTFFWFILVFTIALVIQILELPILTSWIAGLILYLPNILAAVVIVFVGFITGKFVADLIAAATAKTGITGGKYVGRLMNYIIVLVSIIIAINQIGIDIRFLTNLITIVVALLLFGAALSFGLGSKTSVSNILGSYYMQKAYQVGNTIKIGEVEGLIIRITTTSVFLDTENGLAMIPAKKFNEEKTILIKKNNS